MVSCGVRCLRLDLRNFVNRRSMMRSLGSPTEPRRPPGLIPLHGSNLIFVREVNGTICLACLSRACGCCVKNH